MAEVDIDPDEFLEAAMAPTEKEVKEEKKKQKEKEKQEKVPKEHKRAFDELAKEISKAKPSKEELQKHQGLILTIRKFLTRPAWQEYLEDSGFKYTPKDLRGMSTEELEELLERIETTITNRHPSSMLAFAQDFGLSVVEAISQRPPLKQKFDLAGLSEIARQDEELQDAIAVLDIKYGTQTLLSPEKRYMFCLAKLAYLVSQQNAARNAMLAQAQAQAYPQGFPQAQVPPQMQPMYDVQEEEKSPGSLHSMSMGLGGLAPEVN